MKLHNKKIAIVGGGPGGLTLARLLQLKGADVKVYERDVNKDARVQGSPLDMHDESGLAALQKAELMDAFKKNFRPGADKKIITDNKARILLTDHDTKPEENFGHGHFRPEIDRGPLRRILLESLRPGTVVWDSHFISLEKQGEGRLLHFKNGTSAYADIVAAADGANSKIRPYITDIRPFYSGVMMLEGYVADAKNAIPHIAAMVKDGKVMAFGNGKCILGGQKGDGAFGYYASIKVSGDWPAASGIDFSDRAQVLAWFKSAYTEWDSIWYELFEHAATPFIPRLIYCMPLDQHWQALPDFTMLGDAAHVMPPFAGEGANMAMLDALELSECLTSDRYGTVHEAIAAYESAMRIRGAAAAKESLDNGELMHSEDALEKMLAFFEGH